MAVVLVESGGDDGGDGGGGGGGWWWWLMVVVGGWWLMVHGLVWETVSYQRYCGLQLLRRNRPHASDGANDLLGSHPIPHLRSRVAHVWLYLVAGRSSGAPHNPTTTQPSHAQLRFAKGVTS